MKFIVAIGGLRVYSVYGSCPCRVYKSLKMWSSEIMNSCDSIHQMANTPITGNTIAAVVSEKDERPSCLYFHGPGGYCFKQKQAQVYLKGSW